MSPFTITGNLVDVHQQKIYPAEIVIENRKIVSIKATQPSPSAEVGEGFILPGFIDSHVHIESSMLVPSEFARLAVVHGTIATVSDPHEIANTCGMEGVEFMIENGKTVPFKFNFGAPSCVPATVFETAGATLDAADVEKLLQRDEIKYLSEMMNFPGVLNGDEEVMKKIAAAHRLLKPVDGHAPGLRGEDAKRYIQAPLNPPQGGTLANTQSQSPQTPPKEGLPITQSQPPQTPPKEGLPITQSQLLEDSDRGENFRKSESSKVPPCGGFRGAAGSSDIRYNYQTAEPMIYGLLKKYVKKHRENPTLAENVLWQLLRGRQLDGYKFRRQHIISSYIADFVCLSKKLIIEVDGLIHQIPENKISDAQRTADLNKYGFDVLRFTNEEITGNTDYVLSAIILKINKTTPAKTGSEIPPSGSGEAPLNPPQGGTLANTQSQPPQTPPKEGLPITQSQPPQTPPKEGLPITQSQPPQTPPKEGLPITQSQLLEDSDRGENFRKSESPKVPPCGGFRGAVITTDHECFTAEEALDKLQYGMKIIIREGSAAKNFEALIDLLNDHSDMIMFCSDDKHPDSLVLGHINQLCARAVAKGIDIFKIVKAACVNPVHHYKLDVGLLKQGDAADFIVVKNLETFDVIKTFINGELVAEDGKSKIKSQQSKVINNFSCTIKTIEDFEIKDSNFLFRGPVGVIEALDGQLITNKLSLTLKTVDGKMVSDVENDILKIVVVNRYNDAPVAKSFIKNFGLKQGALASSVAHDSHNIVAVGVDDESICKAVNMIIEHRGGISCVSDNVELIVPLPVAGLMSNENGYHVAQQYSMIDKAVKQAGSTLASPFMTLSFMALLVIPHLKLSDKGLFDGDKFIFVN